MCHAAVVMTCAAVGLSIIHAGRVTRGTAAEKRLRRAWAWLIVFSQVIIVSYWLLPGKYDLQRSLPLHICDLAPWAAAAALLTNLRWARTMTYFWGIGLCTQAFVTPVIEEGWTHGAFWYFWIQHTQIVATAGYLLVVDRYRPTWYDFAVGTGTSVLYVLAMLAFNEVMNTNYGYVGRSSPEARTIVDSLGSWPIRVLWMSLLVTGVFALLTLVWRAPARPSDTSAADADRA